MSRRSVSDSSGGSQRSAPTAAKSQLWPFRLVSKTIMNDGSVWALWIALRTAMMRRIAEAPAA
jgi:hypothetical protein